MDMDDKRHSGPPPSVGWWPASIIDSESLRWWNGKWWSRPAWLHESPETAARAAACMSGCQNLIRWRHRPDDWPDDWPERSKT